MKRLATSTNDILKLKFPNINFPNTSYDNIPDTHTSDDNYFKNLINEERILDELNKSAIEFIATPRYCVFDFIGQLENINIFLELKSRNCNIDTFPTTIAPISKVNYYINLRKMNKSINNIFIFIFTFEDGLAYYIQYRKNIFDNLKKMKLPNGEYYNIPTCKLKPLNELIISPLFL